MNCDETRAGLEGDGPAAEPEIAEHLRGCADCRGYASQLEGENDLLTHAFSKPPANARWQNVKNRLDRQLQRPAPRGRMRRPAQGAPWFWYAAGVAAALLLGILIFVFTRSGGEKQVAREEPPKVIERDPSAPRPEVPPGKTPPATLESKALAQGMARLRERVKDSNILDDLEQLQEALRQFEDPAPKSAAEDAELYLDRVLAVEDADAAWSQEVMAEIQAAGIAQRLRMVLKGFDEWAPEPVVKTLEVAASTLEEAGKLAGSAERASGKEREAEQRFRQGDYPQAMADYRAFAASHPNEKRAGMANYSAAFIQHKKLAQPQEARAAYRSVAQQNSMAALAQHAQFRIAQTYEQSGGTSEAIKAYEEVLKKAPRSVRSSALPKKVEYLRLKEKGVKAEPPGWAHTVSPLRKDAKPTEKREKKPSTPPVKTQD